jgi:hypothetical protein
MNLREQKAKIEAEIAAYPRPIAGCDAQFSALLEERARLARELERLQSSSTPMPFQKAT